MTCALSVQRLNHKILLLMWTLKVDYYLWNVMILRQKRRFGFFISVWIIVLSYMRIIVQCYPLHRNYSFLHVLCNFSMYSSIPRPVFSSSLSFQHV